MAKTKRIQGASKGAGASRAAASDRVGDKPPTPTSVAVGDSPSEAPVLRAHAEVIRTW
jgi:predicted mannosyl-3-phosphoglycerate phosphatase (HAD superfamily)